MHSFWIDRVRLLLELPDALIDGRFLPFAERGTEEAGALRGTIRVSLAKETELTRTRGETPVCYETDFARTEIFGDRVNCLFRDDGFWLGLSVGDGQVLCVPRDTMRPGEAAAAALFDDMKGGVFLLLRQLGYYVLHSSSVVVNGRVLAFTAESGIGKTTHTRFWEEIYHTPVFNGDMILLDAEAALPQAIGIPWSGSTGITTTERLPLAGVFFLERGKKNEVREVSELEKLILLTQRMLSVNTDHRAFLKNAERLNGIAGQLPCARLLCRPDAEAARTARAYAESHNWI